ncbi:LRR amino-terminal domain protein [Medicago truncatula]|uniref:LRR amino-terminal domain protein n=2 Tax=Medicago truncatula TaxID=3880 RepID=A0A072V6K3_MEDTR|nr:LRR amino-terminal domain protein [Medicago truncatula]
MSSNNHRVLGCNKKDQETLLIFKNGTTGSWDDSTTTWSAEEDCCAREGVHCNNIIGRVIELDLLFRQLEGEINLCILELEFLNYLKLTVYEFDVMVSIPTILPNITHASNLLYFELSLMSMSYSTSGLVSYIHMDNLDWLSSLSSLENLYLSGIDLSKESNWIQGVSTLPSLLQLQISDWKPNNFMINPSIEYLNLSSIVTLDLSFNNFASHLPDGFFNLTKDLTYLRLHQSNIHGGIPSSLLNLQNLTYLDLSENQL